MEELARIAKNLVSPGKGILAADESTKTIKKRFEAIGIESNPETDRRYRQILFTTPEIEKYISGVILFDETIRQSTDDGIPFPRYLSDRGIIPGIKVDKGTVDLENFSGEKITEGLDGLRERLQEYKNMGAKFTKWRAVFSIGEETPSQVCIKLNHYSLARFAAISQEQGFVPIVEPEVLMDGNHSIEKSEEATYKVLKSLFEILTEQKVLLQGLLLKTNWVHPGKDSQAIVDNEDIAKRTIRVLKEAVPSEVAGIVFLSGGDSPEKSTSHLDMINKIDQVPWEISFSFGRALQEPALKAWAGDDNNKVKAQEKFLKRARLNSLARSGKYEKKMEEEG